MPWRCKYGHRHTGQPDAAGCPDYIEKVWRPASAVEEARKRIEEEAERKIEAAKHACDRAIHELMRRQPDDVLIFLVDDFGRELSPEEKEILIRFGKSQRGEET